MNHTGTGRAQRKTVMIFVKDGKIQVDPKEPFEISKSNQEEVIWQARDPKICFTVEFKNGDSPFYEFQFSNDFPASGLVRRSVLADPERQYEYLVRVEGVKDPLDPTGVITK